MSTGSIRRASRSSITSIARISPHRGAHFSNVGSFRKAHLPWGCSRKNNSRDMVSPVPRSPATKLAPCSPPEPPLRNDSSPALWHKLAAHRFRLTCQNPTSRASASPRRRGSRRCLVAPACTRERCRNCRFRASSGSPHSSSADSIKDHTPHVRFGSKQTYALQHAMSALPRKRHQMRLMNFAVGWRNVLVFDRNDVTFQESCHSALWLVLQCLPCAWRDSWCPMLTAKRLRDV